MGKYPPSPLHSIFSDWHIKNCSRNSYLCDIDRLWVEIREGRLVAVFDIKYMDSIDKITPSEEIVYAWFEEKNVPCYTVYFPKTFQVLNKDLKVVITRKGKSLVLRERDFIEWIDLGLTPILD